MKLALASIALIVFASGCSLFSSKPDNNKLTEITPTPAPAVTPTPAAAPMNPTLVATDAPADSATATTTTPGGKKSYTVKKGDTLWSIAQKSYGDGKQYTRIASANPGVSAQTLKIGQTLVIP